MFGYPKHPFDLNAAMRFYRDNKNNGAFSTMVLPSKPLLTLPVHMGPPAADNIMHLTVADGVRLAKAYKQYTMPRIDMAMAISRSIKSPWVDAYIRRVSDDAYMYESMGAVYGPAYDIINDRSIAWLSVHKNVFDVPISIWEWLKTRKHGLPIKEVRDETTMLMHAILAAEYQIADRRDSRCIALAARRDFTDHVLKVAASAQPRDTNHADLRGYDVYPSFDVRRIISWMWDAHRLPFIVRDGRLYVPEDLSQEVAHSLVTMLQLNNLPTETISRITDDYHL